MNYEIKFSGAVRYGKIKQGREQIFAPDLVKGIKKRYSFWEAPDSLENFDLEQGAVFSLGKFQGNVIGSMQLFNTGILVESSLNTTVLDDFTDDLTNWATSKFGFTLEPVGAVERSYRSTVQASFDDCLIDRLKEFDAALSFLNEKLSDQGISGHEARLTGIIAHTDDTIVRPIVPSKFILERKVQSPFSEDVFFSEAPLPTDQHIELLNMFELA